MHVVRTNLFVAHFIRNTISMMDHHTPKRKKYQKMYAIDGNQIISTR
jgi:hypothetical protein